jgi:hypothetical protein
MRHPRPLHSLIALLAGCAIQPLSAAGWDHQLAGAGSAAAAPVDVVASSDARWLVVRRDESNSLQREVAGQAATIATPVADGATLLPLPAGVLLHESLNGRSVLRRFDAQGLMTWRREQNSALSLLPDAAGGIWAESRDFWQRVAPDGSAGAQLRMSAFPVLARTIPAENPDPLRLQRPQRAVDAASGDLLAGGWSLLANGAAGNAELARFGRDGAQKWSWSDSGRLLDIDFTAVATGPAGSSCAAARKRDGSSVMRLCFGAAGQPTWSVTRQLGLNWSTPVIAVAADGSLYAVDMNAQEAALSRTGSNGIEQWRQPLPLRIGEACSAPAANCSLRLEDDGDVSVLGFTTGGISQRARLLRFSAAGQLRADSDLQVSIVYNASREAGGTLLVSGAREAGALRLVEAGALGQPVTELSSVPAPLTAAVADLAASGDGGSYAVSAVPGASVYRITRLGADGGVRWSREYPGAFITARLAASTRRACVAEINVRQGRPANRIRCVDGQSGNSLWDRDMAAPPAFRGRDPQLPSLFRLREDDTLAVSFPYLGISLLSPAGSTAVSYPTSELTPLADINRSRDTLIVERPADAAPGSGAGTLTRRIDGGRVIFSRDLATTAMQPLQVALGDDDTVLVVGTETPTATAIYVWSLSGDGELLWKRGLVAGFGPPTLQLAGERVLISRPVGAATGALQVYLDVLTRDQGYQTWRKVVPADRAVVDVTAQRFVTLRAGNGRWSARGLALADGAEQPELTFGCGQEQCALSAVLADAGTAFLGNGQFVNARGYQTGASIRVDQPGVAGAWGAAYADGEGLVIDWFSQARLLFAPWFSYAKSGGNDPAQLRWHLAQAANVAPGAKVANLEIYSVTRGIFDTPSGRDVSPVGSGTLRFSDCDNAVLAYSFDRGENSPQSGTLALTRLTPSAAPCELADGSIAPSQANPPARGFDARMGGSWYEAATAGQGIQMTVQPNGPYFGAWFTYDVDGAGDDQGLQHWFTLYGNLAQAQDGRVELLVVQTIGGAFDSVPTRNRYIVGQATLQMQSCDSATLQYHFDDSELAGPYAGLSGDIALNKEGGCAP